MENKKEPRPVQKLLDIQKGKSELAWGSWYADKEYLKYFEKQLKRQKTKDLQIELFKPSDDAKGTGGLRE